MRITSPAGSKRTERSGAEFEQFVNDTSAALLRTAYLVAWDLTEAEDLVQECLLVLARRWPRVRSMEHPHAYARQVLINLALGGTKSYVRNSILDRDGWMVVSRTVRASTPFFSTIALVNRLSRRQSSMN